MLNTLQHKYYEQNWVIYMIVVVHRLVCSFS